jgi:hypothetical protein
VTRIMENLSLGVRLRLFSRNEELMRYRMLGQILLFLALPVFAQGPENPIPTNCVIVDSGKGWNVYVHGEEKAHWITSRSTLPKAAKDCRDYFKKQKKEQDGGKSKASKSKGHESN